MVCDLRLISCAHPDCYGEEKRRRSVYNRKDIQYDGEFSADFRSDEHRSYKQQCKNCAYPGDFDSISEIYFGLLGGYSESVACCGFYDWLKQGNAEADCAD
jgi:hypothetical protein